MITNTTSPIPYFNSGSSHISCAGSSSSVFYTSSSNVGIGVVNPSQRLTINSSGSVIMGNPSPSHKLDIHSEKIKELRVKFLDLLKEIILGGSLIDGSFLNEIIDIFDTCGGWNIDIESDFVKIESLTRDKKIPRMVTSQINDMITERIISTWGFDLKDVGEILRK